MCECVCRDGSVCGRRKGEHVQRVLEGQMGLVEGEMCVCVYVCVCVCRDEGVWRERRVYVCRDGGVCGGRDRHVCSFVCVYWKDEVVESEMVLWWGGLCRDGLVVFERTYKESMGETEVCVCMEGEMGLCVCVCVRPVWVWRERWKESGGMCWKKRYGVGLCMCMCAGDMGV